MKLANYYDIGAENRLLALPTYGGLLSYYLFKFYQNLNSHFLIKTYFLELFGLERGLIFQNLSCALYWPSWYICRKIDIITYYWGSFLATKGIYFQKPFLNIILAQLIFVANLVEIRLQVFIYITHYLFISLHYDGICGKVIKLLCL